MSDIVELGLQKPDSPEQVEIKEDRPAQTTHSADLTDFTARLIDVLSSYPPQADSVDSEDLQTRLGDFRTSLGEAQHLQEVRRIASACLKACERYLRSSRNYHTVRDAEIEELVSVLRTAAESALGDSADFSADVLSSTERFSKLSELDDLRGLRRALSSEISSLQKATFEKQKRDVHALTDLNSRMVDLQSSLQKAEEEASIDELTQIANRRSFDRALRRLMSSTQTRNQPLTLAILDIDHFKKVNDTYGHQVGDRVLRGAAQQLAEGLRKDDVVARFGGEEFAILLPGTDIKHSEGRFAAILRRIAKVDYEYDDQGSSLRFTLSCGVTQQYAGDTEQTIVERADDALYEAKRKGRNRVIARKRSRLASLFQ